MREEVPVRLQNKVAIVTGAGEGIGRAIALLFAGEGAAVVVANRTPEKGNAAVEAIRDLGGDAIFVQTDVCKADDVERMVGATLDRFGKLDVLCNNAGIGFLDTVVGTSEEDFDRVLATNLKSVFLCCKVAIPNMIERGGGSIVNIASMAGLMPFKRDAAYCASKGGLLMLTRQTALDYAPHRVRVNSICPAFIVTPMAEKYFAQQRDPVAARREVESAHPLGRLGRPEDIAFGALYLASDESSWVTGTTLVVDGGLMVNDPVDRS
jgi:NAD(P)-dependent dehydrogenase (short-subunit alcohol dehydrogenase family)